MLRERGFSAVAVLTLALGIGVTTMLFSVVDGVLLRPVPWPEPDRLIRIEELRGGQRGRAPWTLTNGAYHAWRAHAETLDGLAAWRSTGQTLRGTADPERLQVTAATPSLFTLLNVRPVLGRPFVDDDAVPGRSGTVLLSHALWRQRFGSDPAVVGRTIQLDDRTFEVVGVMPEGFAFPDRETRAWTPFEPLPLMSGDGRQLRIIVIEAIARLRPGITAEQAAAEGSARARAMPDIRQAALSVFGAAGDVSLAVAPVQDVDTSEVRPVLVLLLAAVALLLLASTANVVSVQLARATAKRKEAAVRAAIGAGGWRLARLWLVESSLIGLGAGLAGLGLAAVLIRILPAWLPADFPRLHDISLEQRSVAFALLTTVAVSVVCGTAPAFFGRSRDVNRDLTADGKAQSALTSRSSGARVQGALVIGQVAAACMLLIGGALLTRSFAAMLTADRGYDPGNLLTARLTLPHERPGPQRIQLLEALQERLIAVPNVTQVAFGNGLPLLGNGAAFGRDLPSPRDPSVKLQVASTWRVVSPSYLPAFRLRILEGRALDSADTADSPRVIVVNRAFASQYLGPSPIGRRLQLQLSTGLEWEVVGLFDDVRLGPLTDATGPEFLVSYRQLPGAIAFDPVVVLRTTDDPANHLQTLRTVMTELEPSAALDSVMTMDDRVLRSLARPRAYAVVFAALAIIALAISVVGVFGLLSYTTALRTQEIGVRMAIGADSGDIARLVLRHALVLIGAGLAVGVTLTLLTVESLARLVYGVTTRDLASFVLAPLVLAALGLTAAILPARRATRVDPVRALRAG